MGRLTRRLREVPPGFFGGYRLPEHGGRASAVLMLFGPTEGGGQDVLLTRRSARLRTHAGQVAFPGGRVDGGDAGPVSAALREAEEEVGLDTRGVCIVAALPDLYVPVSDSIVTPVLGWWARPGRVWVRSPREVDRVVRMPVTELTDPRNRFTVVHPSGYRGPGFGVDGLFVWGFTAGLLAKVFDLAGLERPWDTTRTRDLPPGHVPSTALEAR